MRLFALASVFGLGFPMGSGWNADCVASGAERTKIPRPTIVAQGSSETLPRFLRALSTAGGQLLIFECEIDCDLHPLLTSSPNFFMILLKSIEYDVRPLPKQAADPEREPLRAQVVCWSWIRRRSKRRPRT